MGLYQSIYNLALKLKAGTEVLGYGRPIIANWSAEALTLNTNSLPKVLDIGCGPGQDLENVRKAFAKPCELYGIEYYSEHVKTCEQKGIHIAGLNIERDNYPYPDEFFDVVIANQVLEHVKDLFYVVSEMSRIVKKEGTIIIGIPNMAAWHDRLILLLGNQPSSNKVLGPHIRGYTRPGFTSFMETDGFFKCEKFAGSGFYPFPAWLCRILARLFPSFATAVFFKFKRNAKSGVFLEVLEKRFFETNYYRG